MIKFITVLFSALLLSGCANIGKGTGPIPGPNTGNTTATILDWIIFKGQY